jgi:hypothetical protein
VSVPPAVVVGRALLPGRPPVLATRLAMQVAWNSIRIRLVRNLVTVSSVVLAVAFLLTVVGESVCTSAVHRRFAADSRVGEQAQLVRDALAHPRGTLSLLGLLATRDQEMLAWARRLGAAIPAVDVRHCQLCVRLARYLASLKPAQAYLITRNREIADWLLSLDSPNVLDHLIAESSGLSGAPLPLSRPELALVAAGMPATRLALAQLRSAEDLRLTQVRDAGGEAAVIGRVVEHGDLESAGLPLSQILGDLDPGAEAALVRQLALDRTRAEVATLLSEDGRRDPSLLTSADIRDWQALSAALGQQLLEEGDSPARRLEAESDDKGSFAPKALEQLAGDPQQQAALLAAIASAMRSSRLFDEAAWERSARSPEIGELLKLDRTRLSERQVTRLNRLLLESAFPLAIASRPADGPYDLRVIADQGRLADPANARIHDTLVAAVGGTALSDLGAELRFRARLQRRAQAFSDLGYDASAGYGRLLCLVALSLLVCVVGIVNSMMMAVSERFREIATMKCLGAPDDFIRKSFLIESSFTGLAGAGLGMVVGLVIVLLQAGGRFGAEFWAVLPLAGLAACALAAAGCGTLLCVLGALLPARWAARMHPIEAMRVDG